MSQPLSCSLSGRVRVGKKEEVMKKEKYQAPSMKQMTVDTVEELLMFVSDSYSEDPQLTDEGIFDDSLDDDLTEESHPSLLWE
jgi:hypothetical protein